MPCPLAPPAAVLMVRPLLGLSRSRLGLAGWLAVLLVEPAYASLQTRLLLGGPDTRDQLLLWLRQQPEGSRLIQGPGSAGNLTPLSPDFVYNRQAKFIQSFGQDDLSLAYDLLSPRDDLPPHYLLG